MIKLKQHIRRIQNFLDFLAHSITARGLQNFQFCNHTNDFRLILAI